MAARDYQWLFFDADGTLFDFERAQAIALEQLFRHHEIPYDISHLTTFRQINAELWQALEQRQVTPDELKVRRFELLLAAINAKHPPGPFSEMYLQFLGACPEMIEGAAGLLQALRGRFRIAILTNGLKKVQRSRLERSVIRNHVSEIIVSEEIGHAKPAPEYFDIVFARTGNPAKHEVLMIGDSWSSDIEGAARYGIDTCWYNPDHKPRPASPPITHEIASLAELALWLGVSTLDAVPVTR